MLGLGDDALDLEIHDEPTFVNVTAGMLLLSRRASCALSRPLIVVLYYPCAASKIELYR